MLSQVLPIISFTVAASTFEILTFTGSQDFVEAAGFQASAQLLLQSGPLSEAQAPPRRLRGASSAPRPPMATATRNARWP